MADLFTIIAVTAGAVLFMAGTFGLLRFPDTLTRLHALTKVDNLGLGLVVLGLAGLLGMMARERLAEDRALPAGWIAGRWEGVTAMDRFARERLVAVLGRAASNRRASASSSKSA